MDKKFKKGDVVQFTFKNRLFGLADFPSFLEWKEGGKKGQGIVAGYINGFLVVVKVTKPSDWKGGNSCLGELKGDDECKGCAFVEAALRLVKPVKKKEG